MILRRKFSVPTICGSRSIQATHMPVTVKFRLNFLVCGLQGHLLWHLTKVGPMFPCNKNHRSNEQLSLLATVVGNGAASLSAADVL